MILIAEYYLPSLDNQLLPYLDDEDFGTDVHVQQEEFMWDRWGLRFKIQIILWNFNIVINMKAWHSLSSTSLQLPFHSLLPAQNQQILTSDIAQFVSDAT
jgi:hypothetical protein